MTNIEARLFIAGDYCESAEKKTFLLFDPATEEAVCSVHEAGHCDVDRAVEAALTAQPGWAATDVHTRQRALNKLADLLDENADKIAELDAFSIGRPVILSRAFSHFEGGGLRYVAALAGSVLGESSMLVAGQLGLTLGQPFGVCAGILPFNVPITMFCSKLGPAVAAGNAMILNSSEKSPLSAAFVAGLTREAGFPPSIVQVIAGAGETDRHLAEHPKIRKISFTGSARTGKLVAMAAAQSNLKEISLELGEKSPFVRLLCVLALLLISVTHLACCNPCTDSGQICVANSRIYVHERIRTKFLELPKSEMKQYKHGHPCGKDITLGPQADEIQGKRVAEFLEGKCELGGTRVGDKGYFFSPRFSSTSRTTPASTARRFSAPIVRTFKDEKEVIRHANDTEYGLFASIFTTDLDRALRLTKDLEAGGISVNVAAPIFAHEIPFGGAKQNGVGREYGIDAVKRYLESVLINVAE
ncbi:hypothetical protein JCM21900_002462 [Sporobolomyces salmonicolor]